MATSTETLIKPGHVSAEDKPALTTLTAKSILDKESAERAEKNARLKALRLAGTPVL